MTMDLQFDLNEVHRHIDRSPPHLNTRFHTATRMTACAPQVPSNDTWGHPEVATLTTVWLEELEQELPAAEIDDDEFEFGKHFLLLYLCHDCGSPWCQKTHRTWYKAAILDDEPFYEYNEYLGGIAYSGEYNQYIEPDTLAVS